MAKRYYCPAQQLGWGCDRGSGTAPRPKCRYCGTELITETGSHCVFHWRADSRYQAKDAVRVYQSPKAAQKYADDHGDDLVVRWIDEGASR
jgi:hypothetical protein